MLKPCCATYEHPQGMSVLVRRSVERIRVMSEEIEEQRAKIRTCPAPSTDRSLLVTLSSGRQQRIPCPIASSTCHYGATLAKELDEYLLRIMLESGIPKRHLDNFASYRETISTRESVRWPLRGFLVLCGKPGVGKSFGAAWRIRHYLRERIADPLERSSWQGAERMANGVLWCSAGEIAGDRNLASKAANKSLLALDDLGKECHAPSAIVVLCDIVSRRYDQKLPTVVTTELTVAAIGNRYGRHVAERLVEDIGNGGRIVDCGEVSMRLGDIRGS